MRHLRVLPRFIPQKNASARDPPPPSSGLLRQVLRVHAEYRDSVGVRLARDLLAIEHDRDAGLVTHRVGLIHQAFSIPGQHLTVVVADPEWELEPDNACALASPSGPRNAASPTGSTPAP